MRRIKQEQLWQTPEAVAVHSIIEQTYYGRLHGWEAIEYAEKHGARLAKYNDPIERGRRVTIEQAREIAKIDPSLIYLLPPQNKFTRKGG